MLNIPVNLNHDSILFLGIGGGFDVFGSIPLFRHPSLKGKKINFANLNSSAKHMSYVSTDKPVEGDSPEARLADWLYKENHRTNVYTLPRCGVNQMISYLKTITSDNDIDYIVCVDGGVDSLMVGDEDGTGTIIEDTVTMTAVNSIGVDSCLMCMGFGTEMEEGLCHHLALENIAKLAKDNAFIGCCSLAKHYSEYKSYKQACEHGWKDVRKSHIHTKIISAVEGNFGEENLYDGIDANVSGGVKVINYTNPLMPIMWFFNLDKVVYRNKLASPFSKSNTYTDVLMIFRQLIDQLSAQKRARKPIPL